MVSYYHSLTQHAKTAVCIVHTAAYKFDLRSRGTMRRVQASHFLFSLRRLLRSIFMYSLTTPTGETIRILPAFSKTHA